MSSVNAVYVSTDTNADTMTIPAPAPNLVRPRHGDPQSSANQVTVAARSRMNHSRKNQVVPSSRNEMTAGIPAPDPITSLYQFYHPGGGLTQGTDATMEDLINKANREFDTKKRIELAHEIQRYEGGKQFFPRIAAASGFDVSWPVVRNRNVWKADSFSNRGLNTVLLDPEKAPMKRA